MLFVGNFILNKSCEFYYDELSMSEDIQYNTIQYYFNKKAVRTQLRHR